MRTKTSFSVLWLAVFSVPLWGQAQKPVVIDVDAAHPRAAISRSMYGVFFEDINFGADGGLYPELVKNRSFEFQEPLKGWHQDLGISKTGMANPRGEMSIRTEAPLNQSNPHYLNVRVYEPGYGFWNSGFRGMGVTEGAEYRFSAYVRSHGQKAIRATVTDGFCHECRIPYGSFNASGSGWHLHQRDARRAEP